jgi:hypothetical protein
VYLLPSQKMYSTWKTRSSIERTTVSKNWNNYPLYRYYTSTAVEQLNTVKQQHTATATSILTTKSTYHSLTAQQLSKCNVYQLPTITTQMFSIISTKAYLNLKHSSPLRITENFPEVPL